MLNQLPDIWKKTFPKINLLFGEVPREDKEHLIKLLLIVNVLTHDFGKLVPFFQRKIKGEKLSPKERMLSNHAETSAIFARELFLTILNRSSIKLSEERLNFLAVIVHYIVLMHHQKVLKNLPSDALHYDKIPKIQEQLKLIFSSYPREKILSLYRQVFSKLTFQVEKFITIEDIDLVLTTLENNIRNENFFEEMIDDVFNFYHLMGLENKDEKLAVEIFFLIEFGYSVLCDLDEWDAKFYLANKDKIRIPFDDERHSYSGKIVESYRKKKQAEWKNTIKEMSDARNITFEIINQLNFDELIGQVRTLTAPTGSAKTLALLNLGFKIRDKIAKRKGINPKIIYCLPFITITEEVAEVVKELLEIRILDKQSEKLTIHHHLSSIIWNMLEEEDLTEETFIRKSERDLFFTKLWRSDVIITTFVRFWESILSCKKSELLRFHRMANSILIFDEMQAIPIKFWGVIYESLKILATNYNCTIISATATQPMIVPHEEKNDLIETHEEANRIYSKINRYNLIYHKDLLDIEEFISNVCMNELSKQPAENLMIVLNTKKAAAYVYETLSSIVAERNFPFKVYLMTRNVLPIDRKHTLELVRKHLQEENDEKKCLLVCTQLIEAGVNISFERVFRDMAPLSSIIQVAGRCNRSMSQKEKGVIQVFNLKESRNPYDYIYSSIYDSIEIEKTDELLSKKCKDNCNTFYWDELQLRELGKQYYKSIPRVKHTKKCLNYLKGLSYNTLNKEFKLIDDYPTETLFISRNEEAATILQRINLQQKTLRKVKYIPQKFYEYILNISKKDLMSIRDKVRPFPNNKDPIFWILVDSDLYDPKRGFHHELNMDE